MKVAFTWFHVLLQTINNYSQLPSYFSGENDCDTDKEEVFMKRIRMTLPLIMVLSLTLALYNSYAQKAEELLPKAIQQEEVKGELYDAIKTYQLILDKYPDNREICAEALLHLGICYEKLGLDQARQTYQQVISKYPEQEDKVVMARDRIYRLNAYNAILLAEAEGHLKKGNELFKRWEYDSAIKEYENVVNSGPNSELALNARYCIGQSLYRTGNYEKALATFTKIIDDNPKSNIAPVTELMVAQVRSAIEEDAPNRTISPYPDKDTVVDPETGITFTKMETLTGESDIITYTSDLNISPNGKFLLFGNMVVPMDGTTPFELIDFNSNKLNVTRGTWSPDGTKAAFFSGDALCIVPVSPETGHPTGPLKKIIKAKLKYQSNPGWSPDGKKLTYYLEGDLWTVGSEGNDLRQITKSQIGELGPAWSYDGNTIAFGYAHGNIGLYNIENEKISDLAETGYRCFPVWTPDGNWIVGDQFGLLHFYNLDNKSELEFSLPKEAGHFFSWSRDRKKMLFFRTSYFGNTGLKIASPDGGPSFEPVHLLTNWGTARWSNDSKLMAVQGEDENEEIAMRILPLEGGKSFIINLDNLTEGKPFPFTISAGLNKLLFNVKRDDGKEDLYVVPISAKEARTTGPAVKIFDGWDREGAYNIVISLSPNGEKVALKHEEDIWITSTNGDDPVKMPEKGSYLKWTDNSKALLINNSGWNLIENPGPESRIIKLLDGGKEIECRWANIDISPDNSLCAVLSDDQIKIIPIDRNKATQVLDISGLKLKECIYPAWSPDGKSIAFIGMEETDDPNSFPDGKYYIYNCPFDGSKPVRVAPDDYFPKSELTWSPDGKWIAYSVDKSVKVRPESTIWEADFDEIISKLAK